MSNRAELYSLGPISPKSDMLGRLKKAREENEDYAARIRALEDELARAQQLSHQKDVAIRQTNQKIEDIVTMNEQLKEEIKIRHQNIKELEAQLERLQVNGNGGVNEALATLEQKQEEFMESLETELNNIDLQLMSMGDLIKMERIFLKMLQKTTAQKEKLAAHIEAKAKSVDASNECCICLSNPKNVTMLPCRHLCSCNNCAVRLTTCPVCRTPIKNRIQVYNS